jgi:class 3 adenylate cyclase
MIEAKHRSIKRPFTWMVVTINVGGNLAGFFVVQLLLHYAQPLEEWNKVAAPSMEANLIMLAFLVPAAIFFLAMLSRPVDVALNALQQTNLPDSAHLELARRRVVNVPFYAAGMNLFAWIIPALAFPFLLDPHASQSLSSFAVYVIYAFSNACMITLLVFVLLEYACRKTAIPIIFPNGGLREQRGTIALGIKNRLMILYVAICFIPMFQVALMINSRSDIAFTDQAACKALSDLGTFALILFVFCGGYGFWLAVLLARNLVEPTQDIVEVTQKVQEGDYNSCVKVVSNDEIGFVGDRVNEMTRGLKEREQIKEVFNLITSPEIGREILSMRPFEGGEIRRVTVLFSDLRGFTSLAERRPPQAVLKALNSYFTEMTSAIVRYNGVVLQYVGDEMEAVFGAPLDNPLHADRAVDAALEMRERLQQLNRRRESEGAEPLRHGIGIHTGPALAGIVGSRHKISYSLVGDTVNIASRIQDLTKEMAHDIIMSGETFRALTVPRHALPPIEVSVKGKTKTLDVYRLVS